MKIYGLYGGKEDNFHEADKVLGKIMDHIYVIRKKSDAWKWENGDLAVRMWYQDYGKGLNFDMLHLVEWDLLVLAPIAEIYGQIPKDAVGLSGLIPLKEVEEEWDWTGKEPMKTEWNKLLKLVKEKYSYNKELFACIGPGVCLSRKFLEKYSEIDVPDMCNDELRWPLFAQILGIEIYNTGFYKTWKDEAEWEYFNAQGKKEIKLEIIEKEFASSRGRRVFHPYRKALKGILE